MNEGKQVDSQQRIPSASIAPGTVVAPGVQPPASTQPAQASQQSPATVNQPTEYDDPDSITWTASEFVAHDKDSSWYGLLALGALAAAGLMYVITKDLVSVGVVILAAVILGVYGSSKPRQLQYQIDRHGIVVGSKRYNYKDFRSFSVIPEGAFASITFMPLKRFAAPLSIYFAPQDGDKIVDLLSKELPYEQRRRDAVDTLMRKIRF